MGVIHANLLPKRRTLVMALVLLLLSTALAFGAPGSVPDAQASHCGPIVNLFGSNGGKATCADGPDDIRVKVVCEHNTYWYVTLNKYGPWVLAQNANPWSGATCPVGYHVQQIGYQL